jgi:multiple sugar transport system permease protein
MLFPVYWMINVSLQSSGSAVGTPWIPLNVTFRGYSTAISLDFSRV